jgi:hypothetical protein
LKGSSNPYFRSDGWRKRSDIFSFEINFPFGGTVLSRDHIEEGGFPRSIGSDYGLESERKDLGIDMINGHMTTEANGEVFGFDEWVWSHMESKIISSSYKNALIEGET